MNTCVVGSIGNQSKSNKIVNHIEILDESTGQIILRNDELDDDIEETLLDSNLNDSFGNDCVEMCSILFPHATIICKQDLSKLQAIEIPSPHGKGNFYRCPLCALPNAYYNVQSSKVIEHLMSNKHFANAIRHNGLLISKCEDTTCDAEAKLKVHRHCPHCGCLFSKRLEFVNHLERCCSLVREKSSAEVTTNCTHPGERQIFQQFNKQSDTENDKDLSNGQQQQQQPAYVYLITNETNSSIIQSKHQQIINLNKRKLDAPNDTGSTHKLTKQNTIEIDLNSNSSSYDLVTNDSSSVNTLSPHITQNYSILAQEIQAPLDTDIELKTWNPKPVAYQTNKKVNTMRAQKDVATCQFCGRAMLKKNIPTHIRRAHTPKEELVCLNEEQNIFTFQHLKPGQRRKRSARAYDYSLMTATVSIDDDPSEGVENKFITEGEEILTTDLLQLADRIKFGITQIPLATLTKLIDILTKIEYSTTDETCVNARTIKNMIVLYLTSGEEFKYKIKQVGDEIIEKKKQVQQLRADLKEVMTRKAQLERRIQPIVCDLQKLEDQHGNLIDTVMHMNDLVQVDNTSSTNHHVAHENDNEDDDDGDDDDDDGEEDN